MEPGTWAYRIERSTAEPKDGDTNKILGEGMIVFHPRKNTFHTNGNPKPGTRKQSREGNVSGIYGNPSYLGEPPPFPGTEQAVPGRAPFDDPPLVECGVGHLCCTAPQQIEQLSITPNFVESGVWSIPAQGDSTKK